jgi:hypothetical protein
MSSEERVRIGIDFDNTLAIYDHLFLRVGGEWGLVPADFQGGKREVRDAIRKRENGDALWTELQAEIYGRRMGAAELVEGAPRFLRACREHGVEFHVVSHKTRFAAADPDGVDLHQASLSWMEAKGFFAADGFGLTRDRIFFEPTRQAKCARVTALQCTHFIDDLEEVFLEPGFPSSVERMLLHLGEGEPPRGPFTVFANWQAVHDAVFAHP